MRSLVVEPVFITPWQIHLLSIQIQESTPSTDIIQMSVIFVTLQSVLLEQDYFLQTDFFIFLLVLNSSFSLLGHLFIYSLLFLGDVYTFLYWFSASYNILFRRFSLMKPIGTLSLFFLQYLTIDFLACLHKSKPVLAMLMLKGTHNCNFQHHI